LRLWRRSGWCSCPVALGTRWRHLGPARWLDGFGGLGSTVVERNLDRITIAVALIFTFATLTLDLRLQ